MQTITAAGAADVIALAWYRLGYRPRSCVLLVGLFPGEGGRSTCGAVLRADLPPPGQRTAALDRLTDTLVRTGHVGMVALVVSERAGKGSRAERGPLRRPGLARAIRSSGRRCGLAVPDVIGIDEHRYRSYLCRDEQCCPPDGRSLDDALHSRAAAASVIEGLTLGATEDALVADVNPVRDGDLTDDLLASRSPLDGEAALDLWARLQGNQGDVPAAIEVADPIDGFDPVDLADLCNALDDVLIRDAILAATAAPTGPDGLDLARLVLGGQAGLAFARVDEHTPRTDVVGRAGAVLAAVARQAPPGRRAGPLAVMSWLSWWQGEGARGRLLAELALADVPGHRLADLVLRVLSQLVPPAWVQRRCGQPASRSDFPIGASGP